MRPASTGTFSSYIDAIFFQAAIHPNNPAIGTEGGVVTYGQLAQAILSIATRCDKAGLAPGAPVGLIIQSPVAHVCLIAALHRLGIVSVSMGPTHGSTLPPPGFGAILYDKEAPQGFSGKSIRIGPDWLGYPAGRPPQRSFGATDLCRLSLSSGTTGMPKAVALSPQIIWDRLTTYLFRGSMAASERVFCGPQLLSHFGYTITFSALAFGKMVVFADNALACVPVMSFYRVDLAILSVFQLNLVLELQEKSYGGLDALREVQAGGAVIRDALLQRVRNCLASRLVGTYASTEAGTIAFAPVEQLGTARSEGAVGFITPWALVDVCDDDGNVLPVSEEGSIRVSGLGLAPYYTGPSEPVVSPDHFFPGDHGRVTSNGMLVIAGRTVDVINIGGVKVAPERFENVLLACDGVKDAAVFTVDGPTGLPQVWGAIVADAPAVDEKKILKRCAETGLIGAPTTIKLVRAIPRNDTGKILRKELRQQLASPP